MRVFFYGLFMDRQLLESRGMAPLDIEPGFADGYALRIGERATLAPQPGARTYGFVMTITEKEAKDLYSEESVKDYLAETLEVTSANGQHEDVVCYILPASRIVGTNGDYAHALHRLAGSFDFPQSYLDEIEKFF